MVNRCKQVVALALGLAAGLVTGGAQAALLQVNAGGMLTGATGVIVDGASYDVEFRYGTLWNSGTCVEAFGSCQAGQAFTFSTQAAALVASQALLDQVFTGTFDDNPAQTAGCENALYGCAVGTPWQVTANVNTGVPLVWLGLAFNYQNAGGDFVGWNLQDANTSSINIGSRGLDYMWALWTPAAASTVPEPTLPALLGAVAVGWALTRRQRSAAA